MRQAVFLSTGIGNALLMIPLLKALKAMGAVDAICSSSHFPEHIFKGLETSLIDGIVPVRTRADQLRLSLSGKNRYDAVYLDHFSTTRMLTAIALRMGKQVHASYREGGATALGSPPKVKRIAPLLAIHEASQNLRLLDPGFDDQTLDEVHFHVSAKTPSTLGLPRPYISIQPGSGNALSPWKTLPLATWNAVLARLLSALPGYHFMVLGDASEQGMVKQMPVNERIHYAFDAFDLDQLPAVIAAAALHLGGDSALMHLAGCLGVPTVTVWGGSDPQMYGWHRINPHKHAILYNHPQCGPCSRWLLPNTTRVTHASDCPDFACIRQLSADSIASAALKMMEK